MSRPRCAALRGAPLRRRRGPGVARAAAGGPRGGPRPRPPPSAVSVPGIGAAPRLEELPREGRGYAGAVVRDLDAYATGARAGPDLDPGARVPQRVVEQRADDALQEGVRQPGRKVAVPPGDGDLHHLGCRGTVREPAQYGQDVGRAGRGGCAAARVVEERVADRAHGLRGVGDGLVRGPGVGGGAGAGLPPVELGDDPGERIAQFVRQLPGELPLVPQQHADAVQERVQRRTQLGEFGGPGHTPEAFLGGYGAPRGGVVGHGAHRSQCAPHRQARQRVGAGEHDGVEREGREQQGVGRTAVRRQVQRGDDGRRAPVAGHRP